MYQGTEILFYNISNGTNITHPTTTMFMLASGYTYKISFTCDIYNGLEANGAFIIVQSTTSTLPSLPLEQTGQTYKSASNAASYFKPVCNAYITTTSVRYIGIFYSGSANGANVANGTLTIDVL